ncbi:MAG: 5-oxoprolinase subunit PxpA [Bacteroidia bacterium]|nr:5-oxoprolinase subunit PxpA [Bacteroidia bacterium]
MTPYSIDINADVGEGIDNEDQLLPLVSSCNIACGGHAGDRETMSKVVQIAKMHRVKIGAHPSYPDRENFGRSIVDMSCAALFSSIKTQIKSLMSVLREQHCQLHHVKPHGALYNQAAKDKETAQVIIEALKSIQLPLKLYVPYGSVIADEARKQKIPITYEAFADRNYNDDLSLVSRSNEHALITDAHEMFEHMKKMVLDQKVKTVSGAEVHIEAETFCIHGDHPKAVQLLKSLRKKLSTVAIQVQ